MAWFPSMIIRDFGYQVIVTPVGSQRRVYVLSMSPPSLASEMGMDTGSELLKKCQATNGRIAFTRNAFRNGGSPRAASRLICPYKPGPASGRGWRKTRVLTLLRPAKVRSLSPQFKQALSVQPVQVCSTPQGNGSGIGSGKRQWLFFANLAGICGGGD